MVVAGKGVTIGLFRAYTFRIVGKLTDKPSNKQTNNNNNNNKRWRREASSWGRGLGPDIQFRVGLTGIVLNFDIQT